MVGSIIIKTKIMQQITNYLVRSILTLGAVVSISCEENNLVPDYAYVGTSTATIFTLSVSNDEPVAGEEITINVNYVNQSEDPAEELQVVVDINDAGFTTLATTDESSAAAGSEVTKSFNYQVPSVASGTDIVFDVLLSTQRMFPQRERLTIEVTE